LPPSQKELNVTIPLPQDLQDMGYKELQIKNQNGILVTVVGYKPNSIINYSSIS
jgi:hypothetical protein